MKIKMIVLSSLVAFTTPMFASVNVPPTVLKIVGPDGSSGSGAIISEDGYVATAGHVAALFPTGKDVHFFSNDGKKYIGHVVLKDDKHDDALLKIDGDTNLPHLELGRAPKVGDRLVAWGWSGGRLAPKRITFLYPMQSPRGDDMWCSPGITFGDSGGPILDKDGKLVGIVVAKCNQDGSSIGVSVEDFIGTYTKAVPDEIGKDKGYTEVNIWK